MSASLAGMNDLAARRLEEKERRRGEILDAAEAIVAAHGIDTMTMDQVARHARLSRALIYVYFKDKTDLLLGICARALDALHGRFTAAAGGQSCGRDQLDAIGRAYVTFSVECPVRFEVLARFETRQADGASPEAQAAACAAASDRLHALLVGCIGRGLADGSLRADIGPPSLVALTLWGFMHGTIQLARTKAATIAHDGHDAAQLVEHALALARHAIGAPS